MPRPNWFLAFPVEGSFVLELPAPPPLFRPFGPRDVHLTLCFLGACGEQAAHSAFAALEQQLLAEPLSPLEISLGQVVPLGPRRHYSALSALVEQGREPLEQAILRLRDLPCEAALGRREQRAPKPHITLARPSRRASAARRDEGLAWAASLDLHSVRCQLDRVALYTWAENRQESLFRIAAEHRLDTPV